MIQQPDDKNNQKTSETSANKVLTPYSINPLYDLGIFAVSKMKVN